MTRCLSGRQFGWQAAWRLGLFFTLIFGVPFVLYALDRVHETDVTFGEAIAVVTTTPIGMFSAVLLVASLVRPSWRRMRTLDLPAWTGLIVPFLLLADIPYVMNRSGSTGFGRSFSTLEGSVPVYALTALGIIVAMSFARQPNPGVCGFARFGIVGISAWILATMICVRLLLFVGTALWMQHMARGKGGEEALSFFFIPLVKLAYWPFLLNPYLCAALIGLTAYCAVMSRKRRF